MFHQQSKNRLKTQSPWDLHYSTAFNSDQSTDKQHMPICTHTHTHTHTLIQASANMHVCTMHTHARTHTHTFNRHAFLKRFVFLLWSRTRVITSPTSLLLFLQNVAASSTFWRAKRERFSRPDTPATTPTTPAASGSCRLPTSTRRNWRSTLWGRPTTRSAVTMSRCVSVGWFRWGGGEVLLNVLRCQLTY